MQCRVTLEIVVGVVVVADDGLVVTADSDRVTVERPDANQGVRTTPFPCTSPRPRGPANVGRAVLRDAACGPRPKASTLSLTRRHFLFQGNDFGVGGLHPVELLVHHAVQLFRREMHVLMQVSMLLGSREAKMLHEQLQRLELVVPKQHHVDLIGFGLGRRHWWSIPVEADRRKQPFPVLPGSSREHFTSPCHLLPIHNERDSHRAVQGAKR